VYLVKLKIVARSRGKISDVQASEADCLQAKEVPCLHDDAC